MSKRKTLKKLQGVKELAQDAMALWGSDSDKLPRQDEAHEVNIRMLYDCLPLYNDEKVKVRARKSMYNLLDQITDVRIKENLFNIM